MGALDTQFTSLLQKSPRPGGCTYVVMPDLVAHFDTRGIAKVRGTIDGHAIRGSFMAMSNGTPMLPVKAEVGKTIGKDAGDSVTVWLEERIEAGDR